MIRGIMLILLILPEFLFSQKWIDTLYTIETIKDIEYGKLEDFAGNERSLMFDLSVPIDDTLSNCGRPLVLFVHGGAWLVGSKDDPSPSKFREDFAKRGYTAASLSYRLGQFHTEKNIHCNISAFGLDWDCLNMTDTSEWYRAYYRGVQDINGCIRYLVNNYQEFNIDPQNIFLIGESAGGFLVMGAGFIDDDSEVLADLVSELPDAPSPNTIYEVSCIQNPVYDLDTSIASMDLARPDMGLYSGILNLPLQTEFRIRGIANFFGGSFNNIFKSHGSEPPALYLFHQPNDLIVPFGYNKILQGLSVCASGFPFNCQAIINRPFCYGSKGIIDLIDEFALQGELVPEYLFDNSGNNANCALQILDPTLGGHRIDNYWLRTNNLASFFATKMAECQATSTYQGHFTESDFTIFPNPFRIGTTFTIEGTFNGDEQITIFNLNGEIMLSKRNLRIGRNIDLPLNIKALVPGIYYICIQSSINKNIQKVVVLN